MPSQETEINIRLLTGEPPRIRIAKKSYIDVQAILIPRGKLSQAEQHHEWNRLAVYLLLGESDEDAKPEVYVGRTDTAWERLRNHKYKKEFWNAAIVILSNTEDGFSHDDIHWLEWRCIQKAKEIGRFRLFADHKPDAPRLTKPGMCELFDALCLLVSVLGYAVFEPEEDIDPVPANGASISSPPTEAFYCRGKDADATGALVEDGFVVRENSIARLHISPASGKTIEPVRKKLRDCGVLVDEEDHLRFTRDHVFRSPSGAAMIVLGRAADGWIEWQNKDGKTLDEIKRANEQSDGTDS